MKKYLLISFSLILVVLVGCSKDAVEKPVDKSANLKSTGDSANDILSNSTYDRLLIEIAYVEGFQPTTVAMDDFVIFLKQYTFKQNIELVYKSLDSPNEETLTLDEIGKLESENRTVYNDGSTLAIYIYFSDAPADGDDEDSGLVTLGAVYRNTSMIIHEVTVRKLASQSNLISNSDVETATLNHEFGHLFGLVDLGTDMVNEHEDPDSGNHCNVEGCLMRGELQFGSPTNAITGKISEPADGLKAGCSLSGNTVLKMLEGNNSKGLVTVPGLDSECVLDIQANGGK